MKPKYSRKNKMTEPDYIIKKMLKGLERMINMQKQVWDMMKIAEEANITITEVEGIILKASINNQTINAIKILGILEDL